MYTIVNPEGGPPEVPFFSHSPVGSQGSASHKNDPKGTKYEASLCVDLIHRHDSSVMELCLIYKDLCSVRLERSFKVSVNMT